jgi:uncharacterized protein YigE (DUF2233 family)
MLRFLLLAILTTTSLHAEILEHEGNTIVKLNTNGFVKEREGQLTPNFFLKPNEVFYLMESDAADILETRRYERRRTRGQSL